MSTMPRPGPLPAVDDHLVEPDSGVEILDGEVLEVPPSHEPHSRANSKLASMLEAAVVDTHQVAVDMLTRASHVDDFAPDASVYPAARDPQTGGRQLEELAFEVLNAQTPGRAGRKAAKLVERGVRRVFALDVRRLRFAEWVSGAWDWWDSDAELADRLLSIALPVRDLLSAASSCDLMARALLAKKNPVIRAVVAQQRTHALAEGRVEGMRQAIRSILAARNQVLSGARADVLDRCDDLDQLQAWLEQLATTEGAWPEGLGIE